MEECCTQWILRVSEEVDLIISHNDINHPTLALTTHLSSNCISQHDGTAVSNVNIVIMYFPTFPNASPMLSTYSQLHSRYARPDMFACQLLLQSLIRKTLEV
jgi:hypothetical protein